MKPIKNLGTICSESDNERKFTQVGQSKANQLSSNRIKPKASMKNDNFATDEELLYFNWLRSEYRGCFFPNCNNTDISYHHLKFNETDTIHSSSAKKVHTLVINVCSQHHDKGDCSFHKNKKEMAKHFTKETLTILSNMLYEQFLESSFNNECDDLELCFDEIM